MNESDIFGKSGNGTLDASLRHDLGNYGNTWVNGDRELNVSIDYIDMLGIHSETFRIIFGKNPEIKYAFVKNWEAVENQIFTKFPMLCRIKDMYADATYQANEIIHLSEECLELKSITKDKTANLALRKLIYCCDEAIKSGLCLGLMCD